MQEKMIRDGSLSIYYRLSGKGEPVMLLHGFGEDGTIWTPFADALAENYTLIIPDLPGSGMSAGSIQGVSMESLAENMHAILDVENIPTCTMIGHSMGGYITLALAERFPSRLKGFGLFHSTAFADSDEKKAARRKNIAFIREHGAAKYQELAIPKLFSPESMEKKSGLIGEIVARYRNVSADALVHYTEAMIARPDRIDVLRHFPKPVLFLLGEHDTAVPLAQGLQQCNLPEFSYIYISTHSGHKGMFEEPAFCLQAIKDFLNGISIF